jgi:hypothetical protein
MRPWPCSGQAWFDSLLFLTFIRNSTRYRTAATIATPELACRSGQWRRRLGGAPADLVAHLFARRLAASNRMACAVHHPR